MTREQQISDAFARWWSNNSFPTAYYGECKRCFLAGANAAMDMHFEPGAVQFGDPKPDIGTPLTNPFHPDAKWGPPNNFTAEYHPHPIPKNDLGGEGG